MQRFKGKKVFVTGAGQGIGLGISRAFAAEGAIVGLNDQDERRLEDAVHAIRSQVDGASVHNYPFDISDIKSLRRSVSDFAELHEGLDIMVANAGLTNYGDFLTYKDEDFDRLLAVNLKGSYFSAQIAAQLMIKGGLGGRILLMSSVTGVQAHKGLSAYGMTKAGIRMLARSLAAEVSAYGITVNALGPGATVTERTQSLGADYEAGWNAVALNQKTAQVEDIASACLFLASDEARHITGETLMIDGGWTVYSPLPDGGR